jgi:hypothetical protein
MTALPSAPTLADLAGFRRAACRQRVGGFEAFLTNYFTDDLGRPLVVSRGQRALVQSIERILRRDPGDAMRGLAAMCARGHGKSTLMKAAILYALVLRGFKYAALLTAGTLYQGFSRDLRALIRGEGPLVRDEASGHAYLTTDWDIRPANQNPDRDDRLFNEEDFTFWVGGWKRDGKRRVSVRGMTSGNGNVRGLIDGAWRPDLLWVDDPMKDLEAANLDITTRLKAFVKTAYWPCGGPNARYITTGTPFNDHDLITEQVTNETEWPRLIRWKLPAIHPRSGALYLPHYWTREKLEERRELVGSRAFAEGYLLDPMGGGVRIFESAWIERWMARETPPRLERGRIRTRRVMFTDPSLGRSAKSDTSAIVVLDYDTSEAVGYIPASSIERRRPQQIVRDHLAMWQRWQPDQHAVEDEGAQELLIPIFEQVVKDMGLPPAAIPELQSTGGVNKVVRIKSLSPLIEFGRLRFMLGGEHRELRSQLGSYQGLLTGNETDDGPDATEAAWRLATEGASLGVN